MKTALSLLILSFVLYCKAGTLYSQATPVDRTEDHSYGSQDETGTDSLREGSNGRPKVGLVLSGGGAKGFAHVGVLKVIEEAGLTIDYIGGTSMGSIVGALYAIGYDADTLQQLVLTSDWNRLLSDNIPRRNLSIEEKPDHDRYFIAFPLKERKVKLPAGIISGQNIENRFAELCTHVSGIRNFSEFPIPYLCVGTDVETGEEKVFLEGYLPACMRASMAIPSVFTPMEVEGRTYVDGGVINNFPSDHVRAMGADIIIGVDVGFQPRTAGEGMNLIGVMEQTVFMAAHARMKKNRELCDIYIKPDITGFNTSSFTSGDSLIARGEKAASEYLEAFRNLADSLNEIENVPYVKPGFESMDTLLVREIHVEGIEHVSGRLLSGKLNIDVLDRVTPEQISEAVSNVYSSLFFEKVTYELEPVRDELMDDGVRLKIRVRERSGGQFRVGVNYNNTYKASILLNASFRNILLNGSKTSLNLALGENPYALVRFEQNNGWKPGFVAEFGGQDLDLNLYNDEARYAVMDYSDIFGRLFLQSIIGNSYSFGIGAEFERIRLKPQVGGIPFEKSTDHYYNLLAFIDLDTYDNRFFPRRGSLINAQYKYIKSPSKSPHWFLRFNIEQAISFGKRFTMIPKAYGGSTSADSSLQVYGFYLGDLNRTSRKGLLPFVGLDFMEKSGSNALAVGLDFHYNFWKSNYLILRMNAATISDSPEELLLFDNAFSGFGLTLGNLSLIGPVELTLMRPNYRRELIFYVNIGYYF
jgi:NTE family protein